MVKQQKFLRDGGGPSMVQTVALSVSARSRKCGRRKRVLRAQVLRMLSQRQTEVESGSDPGGSGNGKGNGAASGSVTPGSFSNGEGSKEFLSTGRTGRRNALPDILGQHADTGTADLPARLEALTTDVKHDQAGPSGLGQNEPHCSQQHTG